MNAMNRSKAYCATCGEDVTPTSKDHVCPRCGGVVLGPGRMVLRGEGDVGMHLPEKTRPIGEAWKAPGALAPTPTPLQVLQELALRLEEGIATNEKARAALLAERASDRALLAGVKRTLDAATGAKPSKAEHKGGSFGPPRWGGVYGKCKQCGTTEKTHAKGGLCVDCVAA